MHFISTARRSIARSARSFSSYEQPGMLRSQPQYTVFGRDCLLAMKVIPAEFRSLNNGMLVVDSGKKGRILLEWTPRNASGYANREEQIRFGLSPEEVGFLLHQLPSHSVEFVRKQAPGGSSGATMDEIPDKVLRISPGEGGLYSFQVDFEVDGVGGYTSRQQGSQAQGPQEVVAQLGEMQVIRSLMEKSIPSLVGWDVQLNLAVQNAVQRAVPSRNSPERGSAMTSSPVRSEDDLPV